MDSIPVSENTVEDLNRKNDQAEMLSKLHLMHCMTLQSEVERLEFKHLAFQNKIEELQLKHDGLMLKMERKLQVVTLRMEQDLQVTQTEVERLLKHEAGLQKEINRIFCSTSMRLTEPLRKMRRIKAPWRK